MSREIKFRAWDGEQMLTEDNFDFVVSDYNSIIRLDKYGWTEHYVDCVEQYTGLKDKNGKEIYEGDIVKNIEGVKETAVCVWDEGNAEFEFRCRDGKYTRYNVKSWLEMYEVIGNIHEPPKDFRPEHMKRMGISISKGGEE